MDPDKWFAQYDEKLRDAAQKAEKAEKALKTVGGSATSQGRRGDGPGDRQRRDHRPGPPARGVETSSPSSSRG